MSARRRNRRHPHVPRPGDPLVAPVNHELYRNKTRDEDFTLNVHQHPISLWRPVAVALVATLVLIVMLGDDRLPLPVLLAFLGAWAYVAWREVERRHNSFAATNKRVMMIVGLISRSVPMMRLGKVTDMRLDQPIPGRLLGYGTITIESAGQDQSIRELRYTPYPTQVYRRLNETIFGDEFDDDDEPTTPERAPLARLAGWVGHGARRRAAAAGRRVGDAVERRRPGASGERQYFTGGRRRTRTASTPPHLQPPVPLRHEPSGRERSGDPTGEIPVHRRGGGDDHRSTCP